MWIGYTTRKMMKRNSKRTAHSLERTPWLGTHTVATRSPESAAQISQTTLPTPIICFINGNSSHENRSSCFFCAIAPKLAAVTDKTELGIRSTRERDRRMFQKSAPPTDRNRPFFIYRADKRIATVIGRQYGRRPMDVNAVERISGGVDIQPGRVILPFATVHGSLALQEAAEIDTTTPRPPIDRSL